MGVAAILSDDSELLWTLIFMNFNIRETVLAIVILGIAVIWFFAYFFSRPEIEEKLTKLTTEKLEYYHYDGLEVSFNGRDAVITGTVKSEARKMDVQFLVNSIYGVENVNVERVSMVRMAPSTKGIGVVAKSANRMSGWIYLAAQIFVLLAIALLLGFLLGWVQAFGRSRERGQSSSTIAIPFHREQIAKVEEQVAKEAYRAAALELRIETYHQENLRLQADLTKMEEETTKPVPEEAAAVVVDRDDLQTLKGVGAILEKRLNDAEVYHFKQIAGWTAKDRRFFMEKIKGLEGTLKRYNLISQAKKLVLKKRK